MPPFLRVTSCSPSARARTVTAHSLKAVGIEERPAGPRRAWLLRHSRGAGGRILRIGLRISSRGMWRPTPLALLDHLHHGGKVLLTQAFSVGTGIGALGELSQLHSGAQA